MRQAALASAILVVRVVEDVTEPSLGQAYALGRASAFTEVAREVERATPGVGHCVAQAFGGLAVWLRSRAREGGVQ